MEKSKCKHTKLVMEKKNNNYCVYESIPSKILDRFPLITMRLVEKPPTIISWCADCGIKYKEIEQQNADK